MNRRTFLLGTSSLLFGGMASGHLLRRVFAGEGDSSPFCEHIDEFRREQIGSHRVLYAFCADCAKFVDPMELVSASGDLKGKSLLEVFSSDSGIFHINRDKIIRVASVNGQGGPFEIWIKKDIHGMPVLVYLPVDWTEYVVQEEDEAVVIISLDKPREEIFDIKRPGQPIVNPIVYQLR